MHDIWAALIFGAICTVAVVLAEMCNVLKDIYCEMTQEFYAERKDD